MASTYRISVIMGIYNCAPTLQEALDSLYAQTYQDFEIIMCEDGSSDNTWEIAQKNKELHSNIVLLRNQHNLGLNQTLNNCLAVAQGEYIARMDGDDISLPTRFEKEVSFLDSHPEYAIVSTPMIHFDENGEFMRGNCKEGEPNISIFNSGSPFCHAPCMVRSIAYKTVGGYTISPRLLRVEDYHLWMKMYAHGYKGYNLSEHLYAMRDDINATKRRTLKARINGINAHWIAYRTLNLSFAAFVRYSVMNLILGMIPIVLYNFLRKKEHKATIKTIS